MLRKTSSWIILQPGGDHLRGPADSHGPGTFRVEREQASGKHLPSAKPSRCLTEEVPLPALLPTSLNLSLAKAHVGSGSGLMQRTMKGSRASGGWLPEPRLHPGSPFLRSGPARGRFPPAGMETDLDENTYVEGGGLARKEKEQEHLYEAEKGQWWGLGFRAAGCPPAGPPTQALPHPSL